MNLEVGAVLEGVVTGITKFGAFVSLGEGKSGMIHISEITHSFVKDIRDYISDNQTVRVKIIGIDNDNKISLSMKKVDQPEGQARPPRPRDNTQKRPPRPRNNAPKVITPTQIDFEPMRKPADELSFEEKLGRFKQDSDEKMHDLKKYMESKRGHASRRGAQHNRY